MPVKAGIRQVCTLVSDSRMRGNDEKGFVPAKSLHLGVTSRHQTVAKILLPDPLRGGKIRIL